ncbi:hypothetical protein ABIB26_004425 [Arthrobacter sp. UYEF20]
MFPFKTHAFHSTEPDPLPGEESLRSPGRPLNHPPPGALPPA